MIHQSEFVFRSVKLQVIITHQIFFAIILILFYFKFIKNINPKIEQNIKCIDQNSTLTSSTISYAIHTKYRDKRELKL